MYVQAGGPEVRLTRTTASSPAATSTLGIATSCLEKIFVRGGRGTHGEKEEETWKFVFRHNTPTAVKLLPGLLISTH